MSWWHGSEQANWIRKTTLRILLWNPGGLSNMAHKRRQQPNQQKIDINFIHDNIYHHAAVYSPQITVLEGLEILLFQWLPVDPGFIVSTAVGVGRLALRGPYTLL